MIDNNEIASKITEEKDNLIAKAFTMQIGMLLRENGIFPIATEYAKQGINNITDANEYRLVSEYGVVFTKLDTSEHDKQVRADERAKVLEEELQNFAQWLWDSHYLVDEAFTIRLVEQYKMEQLKGQKE